MGTNYYFKIKRTKQNVKNNKIELFNIIQKKIDNYIDEITRIHICKSSCGWPISFQKNEYFSSVAELKEFYNKYKDYLSIIDEYDREYSTKELDNILFSEDRNKNVKYHYETDRYSYFDSEGYFFDSRDFS